MRRWVSRSTPGCPAKISRARSCGTRVTGTAVPIDTMRALMHSLKHAHGSRGSLLRRCRAHAQPRYRRGMHIEGTGIAHDRRARAA
ncbi:hypothetical protein GCM10027024_23490 [Microbacterium insulae]